MRFLRRRFDDVGPDEGDTENYVALPEHQAQLVLGLEKYPWFRHLDRRNAQEFVQRGGQGCFVVRPSTSTRSLTLTLCHGNRSYNILIRRRDDGLIALGSKKHNELTFRTVEEMCKHYSKHELILYSGGELTGKTLLKFHEQVVTQPPKPNNQSVQSHLSLDTLDIPKTLEESVHRAAQRSISLRTFDRVQPNILEKNGLNSQNIKPQKSFIFLHHKSYENISLNSSQNRLNLGPIRHENLDGTLNLNNFKTKKVHKSYENISPNPISIIVKENSEINLLPTKLTQNDKETKTNDMKTSVPTINLMTNNELGINKIVENKDLETDGNHLSYKNYNRNQVGKLTIPLELKEQINEKLKLNKTETTNQDDKIKSPLITPKFVKKILTINENIQKVENLKLELIVTSKQQHTTNKESNHHEIDLQNYKIEEVDNFKKPLVVEQKHNNKFNDENDGHIELDDKNKRSSIVTTPNSIQLEKFQVTEFKKDPPTIDLVELNKSPLATLDIPTNPNSIPVEKLKESDCKNDQNSIKTEEPERSETLINNILLPKPNQNLISEHIKNSLASSEFISKMASEISSNKEAVQEQTPMLTESILQKETIENHDKILNIEIKSKKLNGVEIPKFTKIEVSKLQMDNEPNAAIAVKQLNKLSEFNIKSDKISTININTGDKSLQIKQSKTKQAANFFEELAKKQKT